jgi:hypothetical protein
MYSNSTSGTYFRGRSVAVTVVSFDQARFVVEAMEMLAQYNEKVAPLKTLHKAIPFAARTQKGALIVAGPVDYLSCVSSPVKWTIEK